MSDNIDWVPIAQLAEINPTVSLSTLQPSSPVSFIPMSDVSETGEWTGNDIRPLREVRQGFTAFQDDDVLFAKITPCMENGKGAQVKALSNGIGFGSTEFIVLRAKLGTDAHFLFHWSQARALRQKAETAMSGSAGQQRVQPSFFARFRIPAPPPHEQCRIADILDTADAVIQQTEALITKLKQMRSGLLHDLLTRGLDEHGQLRNPVTHPEEFKETSLGLLPREWVISTAEAEFDILAGFTLGEHRKPRHHKHAYLRVANVQRGHITLDDVAEIEASGDELTERLLEKDDLLLVEGHANPYEIGRCARVTEECAGLTFQNHLFRLRSKCLRPEFAERWLNSEWSVSYWRRQCGTSSGLNTINQTMLRLLIIVVPSQSEQDRIAQACMTYDARIRAEEAYHDKLKLLKQGLTDDLLTGRVRVPLAKEVVFP